MNFFVIFVFGLISFTNCLLNDEYCTTGNDKSCYFRGSTENLVWTKAHQACNEYNSTVPVIRNEEERISFQRCLIHFNERKIFNSGVWLSGRWVDFETWTWIDGRIANQTVVIPGGGSHAALDYLWGNYLSFASALPQLPFHYLCQNDGNCVNGSGIQLTNSCLVKNVRGKSWYAAREDCISKGGDLAVLKDNDLEILRNYSHWSNPEIPRQKQTPYWIGLRDGEWFWIPGYRGSEVEEKMEELKYHNFEEWLVYSCMFFEGRYGRNNCCLSSSSFGGLKVSSCSETHSVICQRRGSSSTGTGDTEWQISRTAFASVIATVSGLLFIAIGVSLWFIIKRKPSVSNIEPSSERRYQGIQRAHDVYSDREHSGYYEEIELKDPGYQELKTSEMSDSIYFTDHYAEIDPQLEEVIE